MKRGQRVKVDGKMGRVVDIMPGWIEKSPPIAKVEFSGSGYCYCLEQHFEVLPECEVNDEDLVRYYKSGTEAA